MTNDARQVIAFTSRAMRRRVLIHLAGAAAIGLVLSVWANWMIRLVSGNSVGLQARFIIVGLIVVLLFCIAEAIRVRRSRAELAAEIESRAPTSRNLLFTAVELLDHRSSGDVVDLVIARAAVATRSLDPAAMFPVRRAIGWLTLAIALWLGSIGLSASRDPVAPITLGAAGPRDQVGSIQVTVTPPAYTRRSTQRLTNPSRIDAMAGSRIDLTVRGDDVHIETLEGSLAPSRSPSQFTLIAQGDGFIAIRAGASERRLIGLTVTPDQSPRVRITAPGKDMFLADTKRRIPVDIDARDDLGLTNLKLKCTKVSGSGERFTFVEGELPITISKTNERDWTAKGAIDLGALKLEQGDMLVYRGAAADARPNAPLTESDAFIVEITAPGSVPAEGFSADEKEDKYALSQQMVILKTERLLARAASLPAESLAYYSQNIAAEQRSVRAEFVFMMGGEVAEEVIAAAGMADIDETKEAENESELAAGRMVNRGRVALVEAIRLMSRSNTLLNNVDPKAALPVEKAALAALQQAFSRTRYLLRALTQRERLDLSRRLTGVLTLASRDAQAQANPPIDPTIAALRRALADVAACHPERSEVSVRPEVQIPRCARDGIAQRILSVDPSDSTLKRAADHLTQGKIDDAATSLVAALRARLPREDATTESPELRRLRGAISDAMRPGR